MLRLFAFLITGFWPSHKSLLACNRRLDTLEQRLTTLTKKHNTLAGSFYAETEPVEEPDLGDVGVSRASATRLDQPQPASPFPENEFAELAARKRAQSPLSVAR